MGVEPADELLLPYMQHQDDRLRVAAARTLLRLGTPKAMQQLHGAIDDRLPEIRRLSATSYALAGSMGIRAPAVRLAAAFEREMEEDVALEMLAALGRLGSADAVQRLLRIALPPQASDTEAGAPMRESYLRIAALEALVKARGGAAQVAIDQLLKDSDPQVAAAAQRLRG
jgi:HEAT repeat protein